MINESVVRKLLGVVDAGLSSGLGEPTPGKMCIEAAVCFALGEPHGDEPSCVAPAVRRLKIRLNDSRWSSNLARARGMRRLAVVQLGTKYAIDEQEFAKQSAIAAIRICVPFALRAAAKVAKGEHVEALLNAALLCQNAPTYGNAVSAKKAAYAAADAAAAAAAAYAADANEMLSQFAEAIVQILVDLKSPGAQWLPLTEAA